MQPSLVHRFSELGRRRRGFRLSLLDIAAIVLCIASTLGLQSRLGTFVYLAPITLGHFFLFCNVFRIHRSYELVWAAVFMVNVAAWSMGADFHWLRVLAAQTPLTALLIALECRSERYHGIFSRAGSPAPPQRDLPVA
jgi:hypothetical protein